MLKNYDKRVKSFELSKRTRYECKEGSSSIRCQNTTIAEIFLYGQMLKMSRETLFVITFLNVLLVGAKWDKFIICNSKEADKVVTCGFGRRPNGKEFTLKIFRRGGSDDLLETT